MAVMTGQRHPSAARNERLSSQDTAWAAEFVRRPFLSSPVLLRTDRFRSYPGFPASGCLVVIPNQTEEAGRGGRTHRVIMDNSQGCSLGQFRTDLLWADGALYEQRMSNRRILVDGPLFAYSLPGMLCPLPAVIAR